MVAGAGGDPDLGDDGDDTNEARDGENGGFVS